VIRAVWISLLVVGCARNGNGLFSPPPEQFETPRARNPAGVVADGRFSDQRDGWEVAIPEGWVAHPGPAGGPLRVVAELVGTGTRVEIWTYTGLDLTPRRREQCNWTYIDAGHFSAVHARSVQTATCVPNDPRDERMFAYILGVDGRTFQLEVHVPTDDLVGGKAAGEAFLRGLAW
jgi:hypothetical protein